MNDTFETKKVGVRALDSEVRMSLCKAWQQSGLSRKAFCQQQGIASATFHRWCTTLLQKNKSQPTVSKGKLKPQPKTNTPKARQNTENLWSPVMGNPANECSPQELNSIELKLPNQMVLRFLIPLSSIKILIKELCDATTIIW